MENGDNIVVVGTEDGAHYKNGNIMQKQMSANC